MTDPTQMYDFDALYEKRLREENQDMHLEVVVGDSLLVVVCDGMGGVQGGSTASRLAVEAIRDTVKAGYTDRDMEPGTLLARAIANANTAVYACAQEDPLRFDGMGTTAVVAWFRDRRVHVAWVGDSRMGLLDADGFRWLTEDHTRVQALVAAGELTQEEADRHPDGHILSRAVGVDVEVQIDVLEPLDLVEGDTLVLTSDGVTGPVSDAELEELMRGGITEGLHQMRQMLQVRQSDDNATAVVVRVGPTPTEPLVTDEAPEEQPEEQAEEQAEAQADAKAVPVAEKAAPTREPPPPPPRGRPQPESPSNLGTVLAALALLALISAGAAWWFMTEGGGLPHASGLPELSPKDTRVAQARGAMVDGLCTTALGVLDDDPEGLARLAPEVQDCFADSGDIEPWLGFVDGAHPNVRDALAPHRERSAELVLGWGDAQLDDADDAPNLTEGRRALDVWTARLWESTWWRAAAEEADPSAYAAQQQRYHALGKELAADPPPPVPKNTPPVEPVVPDKSPRDGVPRDGVPRDGGARDGDPRDGAGLKRDGHVPTEKK